MAETFRVFILMLSLQIYSLIRLHINTHSWVGVVNTTGLLMEVLDNSSCQLALGLPEKLQQVCIV